MEVVLPRIGTVAAWRREARRLAGAGVPPEAVVWSVGEAAGDLFSETTLPNAPTRKITLGKTALQDIETALCHSDPERFARAYALVLDLADRRLRWGDRSDPRMKRLLDQAKAVRRDIHKMHAFVRFREVEAPGPRRAFAAWFEPNHPIVEAATPFFAKRFGDMDWVVAAPTLTARFRSGVLTFEETRDTRPPPADATEDLWRTYYAHIFNPARLMVNAMTSEMPKKYWKNLPEADLIPDLIRTADARAKEMQDAAPTLPNQARARVAAEMASPRRAAALPGTLDALRTEAARCMRCALCGPATQTVFGEGPPDAAIMIVGEQPGDMEDLAGRPLVGPAGQLFDELAAGAGLERERLYLTNAVKHFKYTPRGKRRIHQRPNTGEVVHCRWWLDMERRLIRPRVTVAMGATAALALTGDGSGITRRRGSIERARDGGPVLLTLHPSFILRTPEPALAAERRAMLCDDLRAALEFAALSEA